MEKHKKSVCHVLRWIMGIGIAFTLGNGVCCMQARAEQLITCEADGSDTGDDTAAIQASLDAARGAGGAVVQVPAGRYYISRTLVIYSDTTLLLAPDAEIVRIDGANIMIRSEQNYDIGGYGQAANIVIDGGIWNGNVTDTTVLCPLMYFCHGRNIVLRNCSVKSACSRHMVILAGIDTAAVSNVSFSDFVPFTGEDVNGEYYTPDPVTGEVNAELSMRTMEALHLDCVSADGMSEALAYPCDDTVNRSITVENCTFNGLMSGVGSHYSHNPALRGVGLTVRGNTFLNMRYTCIDIYNQDNITVAGNRAENVGELLRAVNASGAVSGNVVACSGTAEESELGLCGIKVTDSRNMQLDHNEITGGTHGISVSNMSGTVSDNVLTGSLGNGVSILDGSAVTVAANTVDAAAGSGVYAENAADITAEGNHIYNPKENGIYLNGARGQVNSNEVTGGLKGILVFQSCNPAGEWVRVCGNTVGASAENGIRAEEAAYVHMENNTVSGTSQPGVQLYRADHAVLQSNSISGCRAESVYIYESNDASVLSNTLAASGGNALAVYSSQRASIRENGIEGGENGCLFNNVSGEASANSISGTAARGMWMLNGADIKASENTVTGAGSHGIHMNGAAGELRGNSISGSAEKGIYLYNVTGTGTGRVNVTGNEVQASGDRGIQAEGSSYITVSGNKVSGSAQQGIRVIGGCDNVSIEGNTVTQNKQHGIIVEKSTNITIDSNTVTGNVNKEISALSESTGSAARNTVGELGVYTYDNVRFPIAAVNTDNGLVKVQNQWRYMKNGAVDRSFEGMAKNAYGWWYVKDGTIDWTYTGMAKNEYGWWYITKGQLDKKYTGMAKNAYGWWYIRNGRLDTTYTGMARNEYGWWYMKNGKLDRTYTGMAKNDYGWWYMRDGRLDTTYTGMAKNAYGWWYIKNGKLDTTYTGIAQNAYGRWYMKNGRLQAGFTGTVKINGITYTVDKGKVTGSGK